jgi:glucose-1-phosphate adenylyltransferase
MVASGRRVCAYPFAGYWVDVGTVQAYWQSQMDLLKDPPALDLNDRSWIIHTRSEERPPVVTRAGAIIKDSMITDGCVISPGARVERSVLSPGVFVGARGVVLDSVILTDSVVEAGARIERSVIDKGVRIGRSARIGTPVRGSPADITTVGKNAVIPDRVKVPAGAVVDADARPEFFARAPRAGKTPPRNG